MSIVLIDQVEYEMYMCARYPRARQIAANDIPGIYVRIASIVLNSIWYRYCRLFPRIFYRQNAVLGAHPPPPVRVSSKLDALKRNQKYHANNIKSYSIFRTISSPI